MQQEQFPTTTKFVCKTKDRFITDFDNTGSWSDAFRKTRSRSVVGIFSKFLSDETQGASSKSGSPKT